MKHTELWIYINVKVFIVPVVYLYSQAFVLFFLIFKNRVLMDA